MFDQKTLGYFVLFRENESLRRIVTKICQSFLGPVFETSLLTCREERLNCLGQKKQLKDLIQKSKMEFVTYMTDYNPLKGADDVSLI